MSSSHWEVECPFLVPRSFAGAQMAIALNKRTFSKFVKRGCQ